MKNRLKKSILQHLHRKNEIDRQNRGCQNHLPPQLWDLETGINGNLSFGGCDLQSLAEQYGTPLYVINKNKLQKNYASFLDAFKTRYADVEIAYSYKTNPLPGVIKILHDFGAYAEVISHFELWLALKLGVPREKIIFNGPAKTKEALELAVSNRIESINIDSEQEIDTIAYYAERYGHCQNVGVRVVTSVGWGSQFGIPIKEGRALKAFERLSQVNHVAPQAIHIHLGTGIRNIETYIQAIKEVLEFVFDLKQRLKIDLHTLDFGGGFGVPTVQSYTPWDTKLMLNGFPAQSIDTDRCPPIEAYGRSVMEVLSHYRSRDPAFKPKVIFEPGRAITSSAQLLLLKILNIKNGNGNYQYAIANGGKNISVPLGYEQHEVFAVSRMDEKSKTMYYNIAGPLCYPEDILVSIKKFPELKQGDILAIMDAGAYFVPNQMNFSNPRPSAVIVENGSHQLTRNRESFENIVALDDI